MRILVVSAFSLRMNTSGTLQNLIAIHGLKKLGHQIDVLTTKLDERHVAYDPTLLLDDIDGYYELSLPTVYASMRNQRKQNALVTAIKRVIRKIYNEVEVYDGYRHAISSLDQMVFADMRYDCILSFSDPKSSHLIAQKLIEKHNLRHIPWIQYWGDPLYIDISRQRKLFFEGKIKKAESDLLKTATKVVYATPFTADAQKNLYHKYKDKITYATQGYWSEYAQLEQQKNQHFTIGYFGNYNPRLRNILPLYEAMGNLTAARLLIGGNGMQLTQTENIRILGFLNHSQITKYESQCDLLVCLLNNSGTQIPGKLYYYASFQKPILVVVDGDYGEDIRQFLDGYGRYIFCKNDPKCIAETIQRIQQAEYSGITVPEQLTPEYIAEQILKEV